MICCLALPLCAGLFEDVPQNHWAYEAIDNLAKKGYVDGFPDGKFQGTTPITRYEMAVMVYKLLNKVTDVESSGGTITQEDAGTIRKLITEFRDEITAIGVRVEKVEERLNALEKGQDDLKKEDKRFSISGEYSGNIAYFRKDNADYSSDIADTGDKNRGFHKSQHNVSLFLTGKPADSTEVYTRLEGSINKPESGDKATIVYDELTRKVMNGNTPAAFIKGYQPGDTVSIIAWSNPDMDQTAFNVVGSTGEIKQSTGEIVYTDRYASEVKIAEGNKNLFHLDKFHFKVDSARCNLRFYSGREGFTALTDPLSIFNWNWGWVSDLAAYSKPYSGLEINGKLTKDVSSFSSLIKQLDSDRDIITTRLNYTFPNGMIPDSSLIWGWTYLEYMKEINQPQTSQYGKYAYGHYSRLEGTDFTYSYDDQKRKGTWTGEYLWNQHGRYPNQISPFWMNPANNKLYPISYLEPDTLEIDQDTGFWTSLSYKNGPAGLDYEFYDYGPRFWIETNEWIKWRYHYGEATDDDSDYWYNGRVDWEKSPDIFINDWVILPTSYAERHSRVKGSYDFDLGNSQKVATEFTYDQLEFGQGLTEEGHLYKFQAFPKYTANLSGEFLAFQHFDPGDEQGKTKTEVKLNSILNPDRNTKWDLGVWALSDSDDLDAAYKGRRKDGVWTQYGYNQTDKIWMQYFWNYNQDSINFINKTGVNEEADDSKFEIQSNVDLSSIMSASSKNYIKRTWPKNGNMSTTKFYKLVLKNNFTENLKGKVGYWWNQVDDETCTHHFNLNFSYTPNSATELKLEYSPGNKFDKEEPLKAERKIWLFTATTQF
ncbi:MAG: S-layer homology domain-containing protein [Candidatus Wallbacteria bacterium]|nr:S-layer homology domain-containing protein [Candidatus Wallbacteria bacterium]